MEKRFIIAKINAEGGEIEIWPSRALTRPWFETREEAVAALHDEDHELLDSSDGASYTILETWYTGVSAYQGD